MIDRAQLTAEFGRHCSRCKTFVCCNVGEINLFERDIERLPETDGIIRKGGYVSMPFGKTCRFLGKVGCSLDMDEKSLDCTTFPVYPTLEFTGGDGFRITGMFVSKHCPMADEISRDAELIAKVREFWEAETAGMTASDLVNWFQDSEGFWSEENIIRVDGE
jgi:hypothetical protein